MFFECFTRQRLNELMQKQLLSSLIERDMRSGSCYFCRIKANKKGALAGGARPVLRSMCWQRAAKLRLSPVRPLTRFTSMKMSPVCSAQKSPHHSNPTPKSAEREQQHGGGEVPNPPPRASLRPHINRRLAVLRLPFVLPHCALHHRQPVLCCQRPEAGGRPCQDHQRVP